MKEYLTRVAEIKYLSMNVVELTVNLVIPSTLSFEAGQYMEFKIGHEIREFYIAIPPDGNWRLKFCIGLRGDSLVAAFVKSLGLGDEVYMRGPTGNLTFKNFNRDAFFVAAGLGVAPFASIIPDILSKGYQNKAHLLFGLKDEDNVFYFDRFSQFANMYQNFKFTPLLSSPQSHWPGEVGRLTTYLDIHYASHKNDMFYLCGDPEAIHRCRDLLIAKGHKREDIIMELFVKNDAFAATV